MADLRQSFERPPQPVPAPESPSKPETSAERGFERATEVAAPRPTHRVQVAVTPKPAATAQEPHSEKTETLRKVEAVMEERLSDAYKSMPPDLQQAFKKQGEETARQIETMLYKVKVQTKKIFHLLFAWLKIIPGVNQFFLEQEAKLKTDEIMHLKEELDKKRGQAKAL